MTEHSTLGHNSAGATIKIQVRLFNSLAKFTTRKDLREDIEVPIDTTVGDIIDMFRLPLHDIHLVLLNGRDITPGRYQGGVVNKSVGFKAGDVVAFSGPVPYSPGYGAPVV